MLLHTKPLSCKLNNYPFPAKDVWRVNADCSFCLQKNKGILTPIQYYWKAFNKERRLPARIAVKVENCGSQSPQYVWHSLSQSVMQSRQLSIEVSVVSPHEQVQLHCLSQEEEFPSELEESDMSASLSGSRVVLSSTQVRKTSQSFSCRQGYIFW